MQDLSKCIGFEWDEHNAGKNWYKHRVNPQEAEQIFFNKPLCLEEDEGHSKSELRLYALGQTDEGRFLFVAFTVRENLIRVISARPMSKKERKEYEANEKESA